MSRLAEALLQSAVQQRERSYWELNPSNLAALVPCSAHEATKGTQLPTLAVLMPCSHAEVYELLIC